MPEGAGGTEPRTWTIYVCPDCGEAQFGRGVCGRGARQVRDAHRTRVIPVRVVEQQPPTEEREDELRRVIERAMRERNRLFAYPLTVFDTAPEAIYDLAEAAAEAVAALPPGPPEPTQGNEWDPATVDAVVEELRRAGREHGMADFVVAAGHIEKDWFPRFRGAARDTGGRDA